MDPVRNPYSPGAGTRPPALVGRDREIEAMDVALQRLLLGRDGRSEMLTGLRGVGKTVLLNEFNSWPRAGGTFTSTSRSTSTVTCRCAWRRRSAGYCWPWTPAGASANGYAVRSAS